MNRSKDTHAFSEFIAVDIETTGLHSDKDSIIEIGAARFRNFELTEIFSRLIDPHRRLPPEITDLTGITDELIGNEGREIDDVITEFVEFIGESILVFHNASFDTSFLRQHVSGIDKSYLDTKIISRVLYPFMRPHSLRALADRCGVINPQAHRALADARVTGEILCRFIRARELLPSHLLDKLKFFCSYWGNDAMRDFFSSSNFEGYTGDLPAALYPPGEIPQGAVQAGRLTDRLAKNDLDSFFVEGGILERDFPDYEKRAGQMEMASDCLNSAAEDAFLLVEAGTGTGKSFAYLLPAFLSALRGEKIFIATRTKNLQNQLLVKDIPFLLDYFPRDIKVAKLKGRANYICLLKLYDFSLSSGLVTPFEVPNILPLLSFAEFSRTGDFSEITSESGGDFSYLSRKFSSSDGFCTGSKCSFYNKCFLFKARKDAQKSNIVIVNHHLFFADLSADTDILSAFDIGVFDEAHQLDSVARDYIGIEFEAGGVNYPLDIIMGGDDRSGGLLDVIASAVGGSLVEKDIKKAADLENSVKSLKNARKSLSRSLRAFFEGISIHAVKNSGRRRGDDRGLSIKVRYRYGDAFQSLIRKSTEFLLGEIERIISDLKKHLILIEDIIEESPDPADRPDSFDLIRTQIDILERTCDNLRELMLAEDHEWVYWFETGSGRRRSGILAAVPLNTGRHLHERVYSRMKAAVFTSATLEGNDGFGNIRMRLGLDLETGDRVLERCYRSPYHYEKQLQVLMPEYAPHPDSSEYPFFAAEMVVDFARALRKNMMTLTTSYAQLNNIYNIVSPPLVKEGYKIFAQGIDGEAESVAGKFAKTYPALLLGTDSFWEGVDFSGEKLEVLFIARLPFAVPTDPINEAMCEYLQSRGMDPFRNYSLPEAVIKFRQGCGRLIRSTRDRGVIVILDNRISTKRYGVIFQNALPVKPKLVKSPGHLNSILYG